MKLGRQIQRGRVAAILVGALVLAVLAALAPAGRAAAAQQAGEATGAYRTRHVIVAVMDGVRYSETFGDPEHRYVPRMWSELVPPGTLYTRYYNHGVTVTRQGHSTIASGTYQVVPNGGPRLTRPTIFDYYRDETGAPAERTWVIFGKGSYSFAPYSSFPVYGDRFAPRAKIGVGEGSLADDQRVLDETLAVMREYRPALLFLNFGYTDHIAHQGSFAEYTRAVADVDARFADLWGAIQADPEYRDSTTLILTNDHGRHDDAHGGYHGHGDGDEGCRHLFLLILGPDTKRGAVLDAPAEAIDLAPTVGELLGFQTPLAEGRVLRESFRAYLGLNRKEARTPVAQEAVRVAELAGRDLGRTVAHRALAGDLASLPATPGTALLFHGLLESLERAHSPERILAVQAARDWLARTAEATGPARLYRDHVLADLAGVAGARAGKSHPPDLVDLTAGKSAVDQAFLIVLLARGGETSRLKELLAGLPPGTGAPRGEAGAAVPHEEALVLYALSEAFQVARSGGGRKVAPALAQLRQACLLRYLAAAQAQAEPGGRWADPVDSLLYLAASERLQETGLLKGFRPAKRLERGKEQDEQAGLPPWVGRLSPADLLPWVPAGMGEKGLRRRLAARVWGLDRYLPFSRELTRYLVDGEGKVKGDDPVLAAGAFLMLY